MAIKWGNTEVTAVKWNGTNCMTVKWGSTIVFQINGYSNGTFSGVLSGGMNDESGNSIANLTVTDSNNHSNSAWYKGFAITKNTASSSFTSPLYIKYTYTLTIPSNAVANSGIRLAITYAYYSSGSIPTINYASYIARNFATGTTYINIQPGTTTNTALTVIDNVGFINNINGKYLILVIYASGSYLYTVNGFASGNYTLSINTINFYN